MITIEIKKRNNNVLIKILQPKLILQSSEQNIYLNKHTCVNLCQSFNGKRVFAALSNQQIFPSLMLDHKHLDTFSFLRKILDCND